MTTSAPHVDTDTDIEEEIFAEEPKKYKVIIHNDEKTTFDFVINVLQTIFHKSFDEALELTGMVHFTGRGIAGIYTKEVAAEKAQEAKQLAIASGFPLKITYEEH